MRFFMKKGGTAAGVIEIYESIGGGWFGGIGAKEFSRELKALGKLDSLDININSPGGDVFEGQAIYTQVVALRNTGVKVKARIDGQAASIASVIAMAAEEIHIAEAASIMIHDAWAFGAGRAKDFERLIADLNMVTGAIADVYVARTGQKVDRVRDWMDQEKRFGSGEAKEFGFATHVIDNVGVSNFTDMKIAASVFTPRLDCYRNAPLSSFAARSGKGNPYLARLADQKARLAAAKK